MTIDQVLEEVERLDREAAPGPWTSPWEDDRELREDEDSAFRGPDGKAIISTVWHDGRWLMCERRNAALVAAYRSHAPALAAEVHRLRGLLKQYLRHNGYTPEFIEGLCRS